MSQPYDATLKSLAEQYPGDWMSLVGVMPQGELQVIDADVSTVSAAADKVIRVDEDEPWLLHLEFQGAYDSTLPERVQFYSTLLSRRHGLPVKSVVVLLTAAADGPAMNGTFSREHSEIGRYLDFRFQEVRLWEIGFDTMLEGGVGVWPLAALANGVDELRLKEVIEESTSRIVREAPADQVATLLTAELILSGLRFPNGIVQPLFEDKVTIMQESSTYQAILEKGKTTGLQLSILEFGAERFGEPNAETRAAVERIEEFSTLKALLHRLQHVSSWDELLNGDDAM